MLHQQSHYGIADKTGLKWTNLGAPWYVIPQKRGNGLHYTHFGDINSLQKLEYEDYSYYGLMVVPFQAIFLNVDRIQELDNDFKKQMSLCFLQSQFET